ncbi:zinc ribbon domain-containing protein [Achromobacter sp.]|uniref:zinc ribbon domain-containing protein n=1 Tax=Achromobacter sp. TaxID=134375 RepID=UPI000EC12FF7|nr:zinc ribbon domain-containing protein [Achromobacter sp.]HCW17127.1 hypothetical protein [Achromobacter sp.]
MSVNVFECQACGHRVYPARLWCPACGQDQKQAREIAVQAAELLAWTEMPARPGDAASAVIATVRALPDGPQMVVRLDAPPTHAGQRLHLFARTMHGRALPWASATPH